MSLARMDLIVTVEDTFHIMIKDEDAEKLKTVGDLYAHILKKLRDCEKLLSKENADLGLSAVGSADPGFEELIWRKMRYYLSVLAEIPQERILRNTVLEDTLPLENRAERWQKLQDSLSFNLPNLVLPDHIEKTDRQINILLFSCFPGAIAIGVITWNLMIGLGLLASVFVMSYFISNFTTAKFEPYRVCIPSECATVESTIRYILQHLPNPSEWNEEKVWKTLCDIIAEKTSVPVARITKDARFVQDLGLD